MEPVKIKINDREIETRKGKTLIQAAADAGIDIPHYCYHEELSIAGNCRMCLVEVAKMPKLQIACNTLVSDGMEAWTESPRVLETRQSIMEFLLVNHPLDCPICDQAGECKLQNYYMEHDLRESRFAEWKQHDRKREIFGPHVVFDGERCVKCTRCVRFAQEITKTEELTVINRGDSSTIALFPGKTLDNPLSANVVDICPVGALTDRDFRFKMRVWYLQHTPSICPGCSTGCNISIDTNQNRIMRFKPRINDAVNRHWICDEGRYCFHDLAEVERLTTPLVQSEGGLVAADWETALERVVTGLRSAGAIAGLLSGRNTNEEAFLFSRSMRQICSETKLAVFYQERELTEVEKILKSPDHSPNFRGAREMGIDDSGFEEWLAALGNDRFTAAYIVGEELLTLEEAPSIREALARIKFLVVQDTHLTATARLAHVVLPATHFGEKDGTYTNRKGRVQRVRAALVPPYGSLQDWEIFTELLRKAGEETTLASPMDVFEEIRIRVPRYRTLRYEDLGERGVQPEDEPAGP